MNSKNKILKKIRSSTKNPPKREQIDLVATTYDNLLETFITNLQNAGGEIGKVERGVVLKAEFGVAENGAVYINHDKSKDRKDYTFYEEMTILLDRSSIVSNMHEAYERVRIDEFGIFISGPSKSADIEQTLVIGAHGTKRLWVKLV